MTFIFLGVASFLVGFGLGFIKFFLLGYLSSETYGNGDKIWVIQLVGSIITLGPCLAYLLSSPLAAAWRKNLIMRLAGLTAAGFLLLGGLSGWVGTPWLYVFATGLLMGVFNPARNASVPLEAAASGRSTEAINGTLNIVFIAGLLAGVPLGAQLYQCHPSSGSFLAVFIFALAALFGGLCWYPHESAHLVPFTHSFRTLSRDTIALFKKYPIYLTADPLIWGVASAASLAVTAYTEERMLGNPVQSSLVSVYAAVGVAVGNGLAARFKRYRFKAASCCSFGMVLAILLIPALVEGIGPAREIHDNRIMYWLVVALIADFGILFGICTNLIEAKFFTLLYQEKKEGSGSALLTANTAFFPFAIGGLMGLAIIRKWAGSVTQFVWLGAVTFAAALLVSMLAWQERERK